MTISYGYRCIIYLRIRVSFDGFGWKLPCVYNMRPVPARARRKLSVALEFEIVRILSGFVCIDDHDYDDHGDEFDHDDDNDDHDDDE